MRPRVLIVDDDATFRGFLSQGLGEHGMVCAAADGAASAIELLAGAGSAPFDLILLDVMLPGRSGWEFLEEIRAREIQVPVIFLTARHTVEERVRGLQLGADDYIIKPFALSELIARIEAVVRRREAIPIVELGNLRMDLGRRTVELNGEEVNVSPKEFELLHALMDARGGILSRAELLRSVWGMGFDPGTNVVEVQIARLRQKMTRGRSRTIETVPGRGYRIRAPGADEA